MGSARDFAVFMPCSGIGPDPCSCTAPTQRLLPLAPSWRMRLRRLLLTGAATIARRSWAILRTNVPTDSDRGWRPGGRADRRHAAPPGIHRDHYVRWRGALAALPAPAAVQEISRGRPRARASLHPTGAVFRRARRHRAPRPARDRYRPPRAGGAAG